MDKELINYIIEHYIGLLGLKEMMVQKHHLATIKANDANDSKIKDMVLRQWGTRNKEILKLLDNGYDEFKRITAERILREHSDKVVVNNCQKCGRLARTPLAKQCRHCGHDWH